MKRKGYTKRIGYSLLTALTLFGLMGCGSGSKPVEPTPTTAPAAANESSSQTKYKEQAISYPEGQVFYSTYDKDGNPAAYLFDTKNYTDQHAAYEEYLYKDGQWEKGDMEDLNKILEKEQIASLSSIDRDPSGQIYGLWTDLTSSGNTKDSFALYEFSKNKAVKHNDALYNGDKMLYQYRLLGDGKLCGMYADGSISVRSINDGKVEKELGSGYATMDVAGSRMFAASQSGGSIDEWDLETGEKGHEYSAELTNQGVAFCQDEEENVYACMEKGIFLLDEDTSRLTEIVSGSEMSVNALKGSSEVMISGLRVKNGEFFVTYLLAGEKSREYKLMTYRS